MKINMDDFTKPCICGRPHTISVDDIVIEKGAINKLPEYFTQPPYHKMKSVVMVCDENTYQAAGARVEELLPGIKTIVLNPDNLHADEHGTAACEEKLKEIGRVDLMIATGSGTVHDITRYHAYHRNIPFFSVPTAASVDGYVSTVAAMTWHGFKKSFTAVSPVVVIADTDIFKKAPKRLTASGVGDLLGKYTALADWKIAHILTDEYICGEICSLEYKALESLKSCLDGINQGREEAYEMLMYGLLLSGLAMQMTGNSRPASGAEHHMSHFWEMEVYNDFIDFYHGEKVGVGLVTAADIYHKAADILRTGKFKIKDHVDIETEAIREAFGRRGLYDSIMDENTPNLLETVDSRKLREVTEEMIKVIDEIPSSAELAGMLKKVGGVCSLKELGFDESFYGKTAEMSPYVRRRLTFMRTLKFYDFYREILTVSHL